MTNTNPNLTATLVALRDGLLEQRSNIRGRREKLLAELAELDADLDDNATRIEAVDEVIAIHDPEHVRMEVRNSDVPTPLVVSPRKRQLQLSVSTPQESAQIKDSDKTIVETPETPEAPESVDDESVDAGSSESATDIATQETPDASPAKDTKTREAGKSDLQADAVGTTGQTTAQKKAKPKKSAAAKILIGQYFKQFDKQGLIIRSLESRGEPTTASEIGIDLKALYPIELADQELRDMFGSNVSAYLNHMGKMGLVERGVRPSEKGRDLITWSLSADYKKLLKARKAKRKATEKKKAQSTKRAAGQPSSTAAAGEMAAD